MSGTARPQVGFQRPSPGRLWEAVEVPTPASDGSKRAGGARKYQRGRTPLSQRSRQLAKLLVFALVVHLFVIPQIAGARNALSTIGSINPLLIVAAIALEALALLAYARLTQLLLAAEHRPSLGISYGTVVASTGVSHVVPGGPATTAAVNYRLFGRAGVPGNELAFALGTQGIGSAVVLNMLLWIALVVSIPTTGFQPFYAAAAGVGAALIAIAAAAVFAMLHGRAGFAHRVAAMIGKLPKVRAARVEDAMLRLVDQLAELVADRRRLRLVIGLAAANWLLDAAALWVALAAFGRGPGLVGLMVAYGLANVMASIPLSPGGLGVIEAVLIPTLVGFGTPRAQASIGVVAYRLVNFWMPIPVGAAAYFAVQKATGEPTPDGFRAEVNHHVGPPTVVGTTRPPNA